MSGIFGVVYRGGRPADAGALDCLNEAMAHRGPDGGASWLEGCAGMGHLQLCSTPESLDETLPRRDPESGMVITADARIDNREDLLRALGQQESPAAVRWPDSQLILEAFKRWGEGCADHLLGDFAFAIWNPRDQALFCARDRMGAAPLCFVEKDEYFAFASEPEALLRLPGVSRLPNERLIAHILVPAFENRGDDRTWQRDVRALMPAHRMSFAPDSMVRVRRYWELEPGTETPCDSEQTAREQFIDVFEAAVRCRLRAPGHAAAMLSGGIDSAGIAAMAHRLTRGDPEQALRTYSAVDDDPENSVESRAILAMADSLALCPKTVSVPSFLGVVSAADLHAAAWKHAHPVDNMLLLPAMMCLAASRDGNRVMLDGASGDVTTNTPRQYPSVFLRKGRALRAWRECVEASRNHVYLQGSHPFSLFRQNLWRAYAPRVFRTVRRRSQRIDFRSLIGSSLIREDFARDLGLPERLQAQYAEDEAAALAPPGFRQVDTGLRYIHWGLAGFGRVAARYGVEARHPWADVRVVRFFMRAPLEFLVGEGWTKFPVRRSFQRELPPEVLWRTDKEHLGWKFIERVMTDSREMIAGLMSRDSGALEAFVDLDAARLCHERWAASGDADSRQKVFELLTMALWLERAKSL